MSNEIKHTFSIRVRYADTDKMGVVYNGNYLKFFEIGRTELMRAFGLPYTEVEEAGYLLPLTESYVKYIAGAKYDDVLDIEARTEWYGGVRLKFDYIITCNSKIIASGYTEHVFVNSISMKPVKPPIFFSSLFQGISN